MEAKIIEKKKGKTRFSLKGVDHTLMNLLTKKLMESKGVEFATYSVPHPLLEEFQLTVKARDPEGEVKKALDGLKKETAQMGKAFRTAK